MVKGSQPRPSNSSDNPHRPTQGKGGLRSKSTIMRLNMYKRGNAIRDKDGKKIGGSLMMENKAGGVAISGNTGRIAPDRRWFGNTRTISPHDLDKFREEMTLKEADPYAVVLRRQKIPMVLLKDSNKIAKMNLLETEKFDEVFGGKTNRKRPKLDSLQINDFAAMAENASARASTYETNPIKDSNIEVEASGELDMRKDDLFAKGQSKRIWAELYKVLDSSDVILQVVDARNVPGTRCPHIEHHLKKNASHKQLVIIINKCDLVPGWVTRKWVKLLSAEYPTLAYHASINNSFGKGALITLLRQFGKLHADKRQISVGVIGYPNSGKSSVINSLVGRKCCKVAPVPGETKVWQYIALMKRIFLIDCPGVVYNNNNNANDADDETETVLKGVVRAERLANPVDIIPGILSRVKKQYLTRQYLVEVTEEDDAVSFLTKIALRSGKLHKGGEPDLCQVAVQVINDWQRGKLPYFVAPPRLNDDAEEEEEEDDDVPLALEDKTNDDDGDDNDDDNDEEDNNNEEDENDEEENYDDLDHEASEDEISEGYDFEEYNNEDDDDDDDVGVVAPTTKAVSVTTKQPTRTQQQQVQTTTTTTKKRDRSTASASHGKKGGSWDDL